MGIETKNLGKRFGAKWALRGLNLQVAPGEIVGLLGPNGAGKSTTMRMLTGYLEPTLGQIAINGTPIADKSTGWKRGLGYLPEQNPLYPDLFVREYLTYVAQIERVSKPRIAVEEAIQTCGLQAERKQKIGRLSKGYKQRVGLAAALLHQPDTLILDEPTNGLDPNQIVEIRQVIRHVGATRAILLSSHIMQEIEALCDRVVIINHGETVAQGPTADIMAGAEQQTIVVGFASSVDPNVLASWIPQAKVERGPNNEFTILQPKGADLRETIFKKSAEAGYPLITLYKRNSHLEDVFRALTVSQ